MTEAIYGLGKHALDVDPALVVPMGKPGWYTILYYMLSLLFTKISILLLYIRILSYQHARYLVYLILGVVIATNGVWTLYTVVTACEPLRAFWDPSSGSVDVGTDTEPKDWKCRGVAYWYASRVPVLERLEVGVGTKIGLFLVLGLGGLVCLISTIRLWDLVAEASRPDFTFDNVSIAYLTCSEVNGAIVVACCMTLKPFFGRVSSCWCLSGPTRQWWRLRLMKNLDSGGKGELGDSDVEAQHSRQQRSPKKVKDIVARVGEGPPTIGSKPSRPMVMVRDQQKRRGSWSWLLYTSSSQSWSDEADIMEVEQLSEKKNAMNIDVMERDVAPLDLSPASSVSSTGSEASWKSEETIITKPVAVCWKI